MIDYEAMRAELAAMEASVPYSRPSNPWASGNRGTAGFGPAQAHNARVWEESQARSSGNWEARKRYLRQMLASQPSGDPYGGAVRSAMGR